MQKRRFEYQNRAENSHKFWEVEITGTDAVIRYGRITAEGSTQVKMFRSPREAETYASKMINEKLGKGYREVAARTPLFDNEPTSSVRAAAAARASTATPAAPVPTAVTPPVGARRRAIRLME